MWTMRPWCIWGHLGLSEEFDEFAEVVGRMGCASKGCLFVLGGIVLLIVVSNEDLLAIIGVVVAGYFVITYYSQSKSRNSMKEIVRNEVEAHLDTLARKRSQYLRPDEYNRVITQKWKKEVAYFLDSVIVPKLSPGQIRELEKHWADVATELVEARVRQENLRRLENSEFDDSMSPAEFERFCARELERSDWDARVTKGSGDQGADVIAEKGNWRIVLQCKKYSGSVGNKAVQEVEAARRYEQADAAFVVSNAPYTPSAQELAKSTGTHLIHYSELHEVEHTLREWDA